MHTFELVEPLWWMNILEWGLDIQEKYTFLADLAPIFADIFVVVYPIFLVSVYVYAIVKNKPLVKLWALYIFFATLFAVIINIWIQCFFYKERPIVVFNQVDAWETLLHEILPTSSFPSDHAVVSMAVAMATLLWWLFSRRKFFVWSGIVLIIVSFIMTVCRILTLVHWPSDIVAWLWLWLVIPLILMIRPVRYVLLKCFINPLIRLEQWIVKKLFHYEQWDI